MSGRGLMGFSTPTCPFLHQVIARWWSAAVFPTCLPRAGYGREDSSQWRSTFLSHYILSAATMLPLPTTLLFLFLSSSLANAGDVNAGGACQIGNNKLQIGTYEFTSDCNSVTYCDPTTNTCKKKGCRRDEFPFGYSPGADLPPRCDNGKFCPDEQDSCQDQLPVDSDCQLDRDGMAIYPIALDTERNTHFRSTR